MGTFFLLMSRMAKIRGGSVDPAFPGWIDVERWSVVNQVSGLPLTSYRPGSSVDFVITKAVDVATTDLLIAHHRGVFFDFALLDIVAESGKTPGVRYVFNDVMIQNIRPAELVAPGKGEARYRIGEDVRLTAKAMKYSLGMSGSAPPRK